MNRDNYNNSALSCGGCGKNTCEKCIYNTENKCNFSITETMTSRGDKHSFVFDIDGCQQFLTIPSQIFPDLSYDADHCLLDFNRGNGAHDYIPIEDLAKCIHLNELADVDVKNPEACQLMVFNPNGCGKEPNSCDDRPKWQNYTIPRVGCDEEKYAERCEKDGSYKALTINGCGCIEERKIPNVVEDMRIINHLDSVPNIVDAPWFYGTWTKTFDLRLNELNPRLLKRGGIAMISYQYQAERPSKGVNVNAIGQVTPIIDGNLLDINEYQAHSQQFAIFLYPQLIAELKPLLKTKYGIPFGTMSTENMLVFYIPPNTTSVKLQLKSSLMSTDTIIDHYKESSSGNLEPLFLRHELDGQEVPASEVGIGAPIDHARWNFSRFNAMRGTYFTGVAQQIIGDSARGRFE